MKKWFLSNIGEIVSIIPMLAIVMFAYGCEPTTRSILHPERKVTRAELQIELDTYVSLSAVRFENLRKQEEFRRILFDQAIIIGSGGTINPVGVVTSILSILGVGAIVDNRIKSKTIKNANKT